MVVGRRNKERPFSSSSSVFPTCSSESGNVLLGYVVEGEGGGGFGGAAEEMNSGSSSVRRKSHRTMREKGRKWERDVESGLFSALCVLRARQWGGADGPNLKTYQKVVLSLPHTLLPPRPSF